MNNCSVRPKNTDLWHPVRNNIPAYPWHPAPARRQDVADTGTSIQRSCLRLYRTFTADDQVKAIVEPGILSRKRNEFVGIDERFALIVIGQVFE